jgi:hypothetical protein
MPSMAPSGRSWRLFNGGVVSAMVNESSTIGNRPRSSPTFRDRQPNLGSLAMSTPLVSVAQGGVAYPTRRTCLIHTRTLLTPLTSSEWTPRIGSLVAPVGGPRAHQIIDEGTLEEGPRYPSARPRSEVGNTSTRTNCLAGGQRGSVALRGRADRNRRPTDRVGRAMRSAAAQLKPAIPETGREPAMS